MRIIRAARYLFSLGLQVDRGRLLRAVVLMLAGYIAAPLAALALRSLTDSLLGRQAGTALSFALLAALLLVAQLMLSHFAHLDYFEVAELQQNRLRGELMSLVNGPPGIEHLDRADFADNTGLVRDGLFGSTRALEAVLQTAGRTVDRIESLRSIAAAAPRSRALARVPVRLDLGITLEDVSFSYPGATEPVLSGVSLHIPAGQTLALVGENGAGKSTLVKLLCGLYQPTSGRILLDGTDLADVDPEQWRTRVAPLFQDFTRIELTLGMSIGHGDVARMADPAAVGAAVSQARAERVLRSVDGGLGGYVGRSYAHGAELSGGQWQTIGLARSLMRREPLLLVLDEPAAALDASAEHELFERYASSAGRAGQEQGGVTVVVSHRFSTVLMADRIAVLEQGRLAEFGAHRDLMAADGLYAELFALQARAYG